MSNFLDLTDRTFGLLTVLRRVPARGQARWLCRCACGNEHEMVSQHLRCTKNPSCGCATAENRTRGLVASGRAHDFTGQTVGEFVALARVRGGFWRVRCPAGHETNVYTRAFAAGSAKCSTCVAAALDARTADLRDRYVAKRQSLTVIAADLGVDLSTVWQWLKDAGIARRRRGAPKGSRGPYTTKRAEAVERAQRGETLARIADALGVNSATVWRWFHSDGVEYAREPSGRRPSAAALVDSALDLHRQGITAKTIAADLGLSLATVRRWTNAADYERAERIIAAVREGTAPAVVAEMFGVSCAYVGLLTSKRRAA